jgi:hypothetical protein
MDEKNWNILKNKENGVIVNRRGYTNGEEFKLAVLSSSKVPLHNFWSKLLPFNFMHFKKSIFFTKYLIDIVFGLPSP